MTEPRRHPSTETADAPLRPAAAIAESTSLVRAAPTSSPGAVRASALTPPADDTRPVLAKHARPGGGATLQWVRAALGMAACGSLVALGTRVCLERTIGPLPYYLPSPGWMLAAIATSSALGAALMTWTSATARPATPKARSRPWTVGSSPSLIGVVVAVLFMLQTTYRAAPKAETPAALEHPLTLAERRADVDRKAGEITGSSARASRSLYDALAAAGEYREATDVAAQYLKHHPSDAGWLALYRAAGDAAWRASLAAGLPKSATPNPEIARFEKMARRVPNDAYPEAYLAFAGLQVVLGSQLQLWPANFDAPLIHARRAVALAPKDADYQALLGLILTFREHWSGADRAFAAATALDPRVLERHDGFNAAWETARARMVGRRGPGIQHLTLAPPRRP